MAFLQSAHQELSETVKKTSARAVTKHRRNLNVPGACPTPERNWRE